MSIFTLNADIIGKSQFINDANKSYRKATEVEYKWQ